MYESPYYTNWISMYILKYLSLYLVNPLINQDVKS